MRVIIYRKISATALPSLGPPFHPKDKKGPMGDHVYRKSKKNTETERKKKAAKTATFRSI